MLKRFFRYYRPYRSLFILDFTCAVFAGLLELAFPVAVNQVIDNIMPQNNFRLILLACLGLFLFYVINTVLQYIVVFYGHKLGVNIETDMRQELFRHLQTQSFEYYDNQKTGKLISRLTTDLFEISEVAHHGPEDCFYYHHDFGRFIPIDVKYACSISCGNICVDSLDHDRLGFFQ